MYQPHHYQHDEQVRKVPSKRSHFTDAEYKNAQSYIIIHWKNRED